MTPPDRFCLDGQVAVVTGAGSAYPGVSNGKATSLLLASRGAAILAVDRDLAKAEETVAQICDEGGTASALAADVTAPDGVAAIADAVAARHDRLDILINNVGGSAPGDALTMPLDAWQAQLDFNLTSAFLVTQALLPRLLAGGAGAIVNLGSIAARRYLGRDNIAYAAAKAGLVEMTRQTALRHASEGLRCNVVTIGLLDTPIVARIADQYGGGQLDAVRRARQAQIPLGRMGDAWDVAHAVLFLASPAASHVTGAELVVDGGMSCAAIPFVVEA